VRTVYLGKADPLPFMFTVCLRINGAGTAIALNYFPPEVAFPLITASCCNNQPPVFSYRS